MKTRYSYFKKRNTIADINIVPYIDVMLVLLVIFMITAPMLNQGVNIDLPEAKNKQLQLNPSSSLTILINQQGQYFSNLTGNESISLNVLKEIIVQELKKDPDKSFFIKGDKNVDYATVVSAISILENLGAKKIGLMTKDEK